MSEPEYDSCRRCQFWEPLGDEPWGLCKRFPPQIILTTADEVLSGFPRTQPSSWCGEFKPEGDAK